MYTQICHRKKMKPVFLDDFAEQLLVIKQALGEYEIINERSKQIADNSFKDSVKPQVSNKS